MKSRRAFGYLRTHPKSKSTQGDSCPVYLHPEKPEVCLHPEKPEVYLHPEKLITKIESGEKTGLFQLLFGKPHE